LQSIARIEVSMRNTVLAVAAALLVSSIYSGATAAGVPSVVEGQPPAGQAGGRGRGAQGFPAQQRSLAAPEVIERGGTLYGINCRLCHGPDLRGGDMGGVNLLRSPLVLNDQNGELIFPVVRDGRNRPGQPVMPPLPLKEEDVQAIAAYIHSVAARMAGQGGPPPSEEPVVLNILVGNAAAGQKYFDANCAACHSAPGDMQGVATRYATPMALQNAWVSGGAGGGRGGRGADPALARERKPVTVTVTAADGQRYEGRLDRIDDFYVSLIQADGTLKTFRRNGNVPAVQITDPLDGHKKFWVKITDKDIHDVTAYLVTLK
jgi:cytochrome c oxidase cbb3-type subunit 3